MKSWVTPIQDVHAHVSTSTNTLLFLVNGHLLLQKPRQRLQLQPGGQSPPSPHKLPMLEITETMEIAKSLHQERKSNLLILSLIDFENRFFNH